MRVGDGENGLTSWIMVCDESEGERMKDPLGERVIEVGVSVWPDNVDTSACLRMS